MKKYIILLLFVLLSSSVLASYSFVLKNGVDATLNVPVFEENMDKVGNNTNCSIQIKNPEEDLIVDDLQMSFTTTHFSFNLSGEKISTNGLYPSVITCNRGSFNGVSTFNILITPSGTEPSMAQGILYSVLLFVLVVLLVASMVGAVRIDGNNEYDIGGGVLQVNFNKYYKMGLFFLSYLLLIFVAFVSYAISNNFMFLGFASVVLKTIHSLLWYLFFPIFFAFVATALIKFVLDMRLEKLAERNLKPRKGGRKGW